MGFHELICPKSTSHVRDYHFGYDGFSYSESEVLELTETTVLFCGLCFQGNELVMDSAYHHRDWLELQYLMAEEAMKWESQYIYKNQIFALVHGPIFSIYHFITEVLHRLWLIKNNIRKVVLLWPEGQFKNELEILILPFFDVKAIELLPQNKKVKIKNLILPQLKPLFPIFDERAVRELREFYVEKFAKTFPANEEALNPKIYLLSDTGKNTIINHSELIALLQSLGFYCIKVTDSNLTEVISIIINAKFVVAAESDFLALLQFMKDGTSLLELKFPMGNEIDLYANRFWHMASCLGINYHYQFGVHRTYKINDPTAKGFHFDLAQIKDNVNSMILTVNKQ